MEVDKAYISHSQYALFKSSPKAYYEKYVLGKKTYGTKYQNFGKKLMEDLEFKRLKNVPKLLQDRTKSGVVEYEVTVRPKFFSKDLFGIIDVIGKDYRYFDEIKTGKKAWTKSMVLENEQILFYALMISLKHKVIPVANLIWAETEDNEDGGISFTGKTKSFKREFTADELIEFEKKVLAVCLDIEDYEHTVLDVDEDKDAKLLRLITEKQRIDAELDLLKSEIMVDIKDFNNKYAESENFKITLAERKNYTYSDSLKEEIKKSTEEIKLKKKQEEIDGKATVKITEYLLIKAKK